MYLFNFYRIQYTLPAVSALDPIPRDQSGNDLLGNAFGSTTTYSTLGGDSFGTLRVVVVR